MVLGGFLEMSRHIIHFIYYQTPSAKYYHQCIERKSTEEVDPLDQFSSNGEGDEWTGLREAEDAEPG